MQDLALQPGRVPGKPALVSLKRIENNSIDDVQSVL